MHKENISEEPQKSNVSVLEFLQHYGIVLGYILPYFMLSDRFHWNIFMTLHENLQREWSGKMWL